jgi:aminoglycoside phosphotransferase (APT) family kinase protein
MEPADRIDPVDHADLERLVGAPILAAERARWGFANRTDLVTLGDGRRMAVQRLQDPVAASRRLHVERVLGDRLRAAGIPVPRLLAGDAHAVPPYAISEVVEGEPGIGLLDDPIDAIALATEMGRLARVLATVPVEERLLAGGWADPERLASHARRWLEAGREHLDPVAAAEVDRLISRIPKALAGRPAVLAHGDWAPVNVLVRDRAVVAVLDWEAARLADPLLDLAWWAWIVWHHHRDRYAAAAPALFETAGVELDAPTAERMRILVAARLLEILGSVRADDRAARRWADRLQEALAAEP